MIAEDVDLNRPGINPDNKGGDMERLVQLAGNVSAIIGLLMCLTAGAVRLLGDFHLAEDAAQEAFVGAYQDLPKLREPAAFASWFRRLVAARCSRSMAATC